MKKYIFLFVCIVVLCRIMSYYYNYTDHKVWIYKFTEDYKIDYVDRYNSHFIMPLDSATYYKYAEKENRKKMYKIRTYDDGRIYILQN